MTLSFSLAFPLSHTYTQSLLVTHWFNTSGIESHSHTHSSQKEQPFHRAEDCAFRRELLTERFHLSLVFWVHQQAIPETNCCLSLAWEIPLLPIIHSGLTKYNQHPHKDNLVCFPFLVYREILIANTLWFMSPNNTFPLLIRWAKVGDIFNGVHN